MLRWIVCLFTLLGSVAAYAANQSVPNMTAVSSVLGTDLFYDSQSGGNNKATAAQLAAYEFGLIAGDCTVSGTGSITCTKTNGVVFGTFATQSAPTGSTQCLHANSSGVVSGTGSDCGSGGGGSPGGASGQIQYNNSGSFGGLTPAIATGCGATGGTIGNSLSGTIASAESSNAQTGAGYTVQSTDCGKIITLSNSSAQTLTLNNLLANQFFDVLNIGAGTWTISAGTGSINGGPTSLAQGQGAHIVFDGTNWDVQAGAGALLGANNTWVGSNKFGEVLGSVTSQSGTTYTFASTDCGTEVGFTNSSAVTATIPATLPIGCNISVLQAGAGKVSVNGSAVTPATLESAHSYTGTSGQWAIIGLNIEANSGGSSAVAVLTGDGS